MKLVRISCLGGAIMLSFVIHLGIFQIIYYTQKPSSKAIVVVPADPAGGPAQLSGEYEKEQLENLYEELSSNGSFPSFDLAYGSIEEYLNNIARLGGGLYVFDEASKRVLGVVNLEDVNNVSWGREPDSEMSPRIRFVESELFLGAISNALEKYEGVKPRIIALFPKAVERDWFVKVGSELDQKGVDIRNVIRLKGRYRPKGFYPEIKVAYLRDGSSITLE